MFTAIVMTSPGREANLVACLRMLQQQSLQPLEVLVADDGSARGQQMAAVFEKSLNLRYFWRPNDCCVARSRNIGAAAARAEWLVFLDSDMLLHPEALAAYATVLRDFPRQVFFGYFGNLRTALSPSLFLPERQVMWCDRRFETYAPEGLIPAYNMARFPHEWAWSGHFALRRQIYEQVQGFDERFVGWGDEDLDFAFRLIQAGHQVHFFLDAWAEQQVHRRDEPFHTLATEGRSHAYISNYEPVYYKVQFLRSPQGWQRLSQAIFDHYLQNIPGSPEHPEYRLMHTLPPESGSGMPGSAGS